MTQSTSESIPSTKQALSLALIAGLGRERELKDELGYQVAEVLRLSTAKATAERELREEIGKRQSMARELDDARDQIDDLTSWLEDERQAGKSKDRVISAGNLDRTKLLEEIAALEKELAEYKADYADLHAEVMDKRDRLDRLAQYETPSATAFSRIDEHLGLTKPEEFKVGDRVTVTGIWGTEYDRRELWVVPGDFGTIKKLEHSFLHDGRAALVDWDNGSIANLPLLSVLKKVEG